ncbi:hypothetical protein [Halopenitus persicus]|uniref:Uncharacterized protein n=1 Tax=Halopenitus persicus TaxID=1048396 RepID=A0A1H3P9V3_9EURY|nr:hypothetical protein [Halopenitus persicus]SDY97868.1 hypothetical protein SAMN05216564_1223 [Halopenitus persicus]
MPSEEYTNATILEKTDIKLTEIVVEKNRESVAEALNSEDNATNGSGILSESELTRLLYPKNCRLDGIEI